MGSVDTRRHAAVRWASFILAGLAVLAGAPGLRAAGPAVSLSATTLTFPSQLATTTSAPQTVTLTNVGNLPLTITSIVLEGTFSQTNTCPTSGTLAAAANCILTVSFVAPNGGPSTQPGLIEITDDASPGLQVISLSGTVADFSLSASPASSTVSPGSSGTYTITATASGGFNQAVSFTCGALPTGASCSFSPGSITPGASSATATLTVGTTAASLVAPPSNPTAPGSRNGPWLLGILLCAAVLAASRFRQARIRFSSGAVAAILLLAALVTMACGGGSSSGSGGGGSLATPAGTYSVLITGTPSAGPSSLANPLVVTLVVN